MCPPRPPAFSDVQAALDRIVPAADPLQVVVFGSVARGDATLHSDLDLLVVMPDGTDRRRATVDLLVALAGLDVPKDVIVTTPEQAAFRRDSKWHIVGTALREGVTVYERP